jgi:alpha-beta hydrolase superfamily lysophospholipase
VTAPDAALGAPGVELHGAPVGAGALAVVVLHGRDQDPAWMHDHVVSRLTPRLAGLPVTWLLRHRVAPSPASLAGLPVLLTNGDADPWVPLAATEELADAVRGRGAEVALRVQPGRRHEVAAEEVDATVALLRRLASSP